MKFHIPLFFQNLSKKFNFQQNRLIITGALHEYVRTFMIPCSILLRMRNFSENVVEEIKRHILCSVTFFSPENGVVYEMMWKNMVKPDRPQNSI